MNTPTGPRALALTVLRRVDKDSAFASLALSGELRRGKLEGADRGLATELVYGVLRNRIRLDRALALRAVKGLHGLSSPALNALRIAAYELIFLRTPAHAAVNQAVTLVKNTAGARVGSFANAVLRKLAKEGEPPAPPQSDHYAYLEAIYSIPRWLTDIMVHSVGPKDAFALADAMSHAPPVTLRVALSRTSRAEVMGELMAAIPDAIVEPSSYLPEALALRGGGNPERLAVFQEGLVTVQDVGAQLVGRLCAAAPGELILDACAGVGGKSTHLAELASRRGGPAEIHAVDLSRRKLDLAEDSARRLGLPGIRTRVADLTLPSALDCTYDRILLDAPCSGLGVLRRHPEGKWQRRPAEIPKLAALQARLLNVVAAHVRHNGVLVYCVCTFTAEEGPLQIARFLAEHSEFRVAPPTMDGALPDWIAWDAFLDADGFIRTWPHHHDADGFFAARLVRSK